MTAPPPSGRPSTERESACRNHAVSVVRRLQQAGYTALWAGGCVRDFLRGDSPSDYDVATSATPAQVQSLFGPRRTLGVGAAFGVILVKGSGGGDDIEVATFRTDGLYIDGRRPESVQFATPEEDAQRRDFTINGLFYDPIAGQLYDYVGGRDDLERRILRAIGDPLARFTEDKLRMLRGVRLSARFEFELEVQTAAAIRQMAPQIGVVSVERIAQELRKILIHRTRRLALERGAEVGLLGQILPELAEVVPLPDPNLASGAREQHARGSETEWQLLLAALDLLPEPGFELALAALLDPLARRAGRESGARAVAAVLRRLKLSNHEIEKCVWLVAQVGAIETLSGAPVWRWKELLGQRWVPELLQLERALRLARGETLAPVTVCERFLERTPVAELRPPPLVTGDLLIRLNLRPGLEFKELLTRFYRAQLEGELTTPEQVPGLLAEWKAGGGGRP